ncbi:MAG TPA: helicase-associated domain-containing protein [Actinophytocola sp.]|nr:helicase-associated domain-containing protein [Actinophytocola sp.]
MGAISFEEFLTTLDGEALAALLTARPDACIEPVPRGFAQLAQRLTGANSISVALHTIDRDAMCVGQAIAVLRGAATVPAVARLLDAGEQAVRAGLGELTGSGLVWCDGVRLRMPEILADHWTAEAGGGAPVARLASSVLLDDLRVAAFAFGVDPDGVRKAELAARLAEAMTDARSLIPRITDLSEPVRDRLDELRLGGPAIYFGFAPAGRRATDPSEILIAKGLALRTRSLPEVPREVAVAAWLTENDLRLTGRPTVPEAGVEATSVGSAAQAAARDAIRGLSTLLDEAGRAPLVALKRGGIGPRERSRLAKRLSIVDDELPLWIDLAYAAGLLDETDAGYAPTGDYAGWRDAEPARQWAVVALAWYRLEHAPLSRDAGGDRELPPPLPLGSAAGAVRRAVLEVSRPGRSVRGGGAEVGWFYPMHPYDPETLAEKVAAAVREAELLGVAAGDRVSELGEHLLATTDGPGDVVDDLADRCSSLLSAAACTVILQSDLTAVVSGQAPAAVSRLLAASAVREARGTAEVWRFTPASVRAALDAGWTAERLLDELADLTDRSVPQPLEYLVHDVARRHGSVRVRPVRSCLVADEVLVTEILNTRSLATLRLARIATTVLTSPQEPDEVLARLRAAGLSPVTEDDSGKIRVEESREHRAPAPADPIARPAPRLSAAELARQLLADPRGDHAPVGAAATRRLLTRFNPDLDDSEVALLAHAVDTGGDVLIAYRDKNGSHTIRQIRPMRIFDRWLESWCYLRNAEREFTVANIESVAPAG